MRKVIGFELKKLVSRVGIYILAILMAGLLVAGVFMYNPTERNTTPLSLTGDTVTAMYNNFNNDLKQGYLDNIESIATDASSYIPSSQNYVKYNNKDEILKLFEELDDACILYGEVNASNSEYEILRNNIQQKITALDNALKQGLAPCENKEGYYILTTNQNYTQLKTVISKTSANFLVSTRPTFASEAYQDELRKPLYDCLQKLVYPSLSSTASKYANLGTYYTLITSRMDEISKKIDNEYTKVAEDSTLDNNKEIKNKLNQLFNRYANWSKVFEMSYNTSMCAKALNSVSSKTDRANLYGYSKISLYKQEELSMQYKYYIENNLIPNDFANGLSVSHTSNGKINAYDFTFFIMSIFAILVMIYAIGLSAHTISGEINNNQLRLSAIKPVKRSSLFFGKYFTILIMSTILLLFGTITSLAVGGIMYGFDSANILMIINGNLVFSTHPAVVVAIFVLSLILINALYSALTLVLSCLLKSDLLAMIISVIIYSVSLVLPLFFGMGSWLRFYPLTNINLFAYFGTTRLTDNSVLAKLFNTIVYQGMNIWISLIYIFGITTILLLIGKHLFKKREL